MMHSGDSDNRATREMLEVLVCTHRVRWFNFVRKVVRNREDAEDVIQEAVKRVLVRNPRFDSADELRMYVGRAISNTAIECYHARRREQRRALALREDAAQSGRAVEPLRLLEEKEWAATNARIMDLLSKGLKCLPAREYEALRLTVMDSGASSIREASAENGIPYSTLRHRSVQGLKKLKLYIVRAMKEGIAPVLVL